MNIADYTARPTRFTIAPRGEPIFSERATTIEIDDEAGGEFIRVRQCPDVEQIIVWTRGRTEPIKQRHDRCIHPTGPHPMNEFCAWRTTRTEGVPG